jgi:hypothetical protein
MAPATASPAIFFKADEFNPYKRMMGRQVASNAFLESPEGDGRSGPAVSLAAYR